MRHDLLFGDHKNYYDVILTTLVLHWNESIFVGDDGYLVFYLPLGTQYASVVQRTVNF